MKAPKRIAFIALWFFLTVGCLFLYGLLILFGQKHWIMPLIFAHFAVIASLSMMLGRKPDGEKRLAKLVKHILMGIASVVFSLLLCMTVNNLSLTQVDEYDAIVTRASWKACFHTVHFETPDGEEQSADVIDFRVIIVDEDSMIRPQQNVCVKEYVGIFGMDHYEIVRDPDES